MAVETGMGGRLDATNILDPLVSVITLIELEHTEYLGNTITAIAREKAGIIKKNRPVVLALQKDEALNVFRNKANETGSPLFYFPEWGGIENLKLQKTGVSFTLKLRDPAGQNDLLYNDLLLSMPGRIPANNAGLAVLAVKTAFPQITESAVKKGLANFTIPARFERMPGDQDFIIDGAHTPRSAESTIGTFTQLYGKGGVLVFGCAAGKDARTMASLYINWFSRIIITTPGAFKKSFPEEVYEIFNELASEMKNSSQTPEPPQILFVPETEKALNTALELGREFNLPILGTGSFYLAGELRKFLLA